MRLLLQYFTRGVFHGSQMCRASEPQKQGYMTAFFRGEGNPSPAYYHYCLPIIGSLRYGVRKQEPNEIGKRNNVYSVNPTDVLCAGVFQNLSSKISSLKSKEQSYQSAKPQNIGP